MTEPKLVVYYEALEPDEDGDARIRLLPDARWIGLDGGAVFDGFAPGEEGVQAALYHLQATLLDDLETRWCLHERPQSTLLRRALEMLRELEDQGAVPCLGEYEMGCPSCGGYFDCTSEIVHHESDCALAALIAEIEGVASA